MRLCRCRKKNADPVKMWVFMKYVYFTSFSLVVPGCLLQAVSVHQQTEHQRIYPFQPINILENILHTNAGASTKYFWNLLRVLNCERLQTCEKWNRFARIMCCTPWCDHHTNKFLNRVLWTLEILQILSRLQNKFLLFLLYV